MNQYELRWASLPAPVGRRPVLLLSRTPAYRYLHNVIVAEVTRTLRGIPQEVALGKGEGLAKPSVVNLDSIHVVPLTSLGERIGTLGDEKQEAVKRALGYALDWPELKVL